MIRIACWKSPVSHHGGALTTLELLVVQQTMFFFSHIKDDHSWWVIAYLYYSFIVDVAIVASMFIRWCWRIVDGPVIIGSQRVITTMTRQIISVTGNPTGESYTTPPKIHHISSNIGVKLPIVGQSYAWDAKFLRAGVDVRCDLQIPWGMSIRIRAGCKMKFLLISILILSQCWFIYIHTIHVFYGLFISVITRTHEPKNEPRRYWLWNSLILWRLLHRSWHERSYIRKDAHVTMLIYQKWLCAHQDDKQTCVYWICSFIHRYVLIVHIDMNRYIYSMFLYLDEVFNMCILFDAPKVGPPRYRMFEFPGKERCRAKLRHHLRFAIGLQRRGLASEWRRVQGGSCWGWGGSHKNGSPIGGFKPVLFSIVVVIIFIFDEHIFGDGD